MERFIDLRNQLERLDKEMKPFDDLIEERSVRHDNTHISNNAMLIWSNHETFLDPKELESYRTLAHERFLLAQQLEQIYKKNLSENRKEIFNIKRQLRKAGVYMPEYLMIEELRELFQNMA